MAAVKFLRSAKRPPLGFCAKVSLVVLLGLVFVVIWSTFSSSPSSVVSSRRNSFGDVEPEEVGLKESGAHSKPTASTPQTPTVTSPVAAAASGRSQEEEQKEEHSDEERSRKSDAEEVAAAGDEVKARKDDDAETAEATRENVASKPESSEEEEEGGDKKGDMEIEEVAGEEGGIDGDLEEGVDVNAADEESEADETTDGKTKKIKKKKLGPLFDPRARYSWKSCGTRKGPNYIPCVDLEDAGSGKFQGHRHHERSCPRTPPMCLVPHPPGYRPPISWPDSQSQIFYRNVAHPKLSAYIKSHSYLRLAADLLLFPHNESVFQGGAAQYLDFIDEMVPDIEWGKTIRIVLDIGSTDASFGAALLEKEVLTLSLGLMDDQTDLAQLSLERGFPAVGCQH